MTREQAIKHIIILLRSPMLAVLRTEREEALALAREHCITAEELLLYAATRGAR